VVTSSAATSAPASTRDKLIDAAFRVVARDGLEAASVKTIAAEAGVASGLLHYHFRPRRRCSWPPCGEGSTPMWSGKKRGARGFRSPNSSTASSPQPASPPPPNGSFFKVRLALAARALTSAELATVMAEVNAEAVAQTALAFAAARGEDAASERDRQLAATVKAAFDGVMLTWIADPAFPMDQAAEIIGAAARSWVNATD
jgi:TetR/AcrR family transcriptional repressor of bet genes